MRDEWVHVGRVWTNGGPLLVADSAVASRWRGSDPDQFRRVVGHPEGVGSFAVADGAGVLVGDPVVRDDSWLEVFARSDGGFAVVQAAADDYAGALRAALAVAHDDESGGVLDVPSGTVVVMSSAEDGAGDHARRPAPARPGPDPTDHPWPDESSGDGLALDVVVGRYAVSGTWYTELDDDGCFARWRFLPTPSS